MRLTIRSKLIIIVLALVLIPLSLLGHHIYSVTSQSLQDRIGQAMRIQASNIMDQLDRLLFERFQNLQSWGQEEVMFDILTDDPGGHISEFLTTLKKQYGTYEQIIAADNAGKIVAASDASLIGQNVREEIWFKNITEKGGNLAEVQSNSKFFQGYRAVFAASISSDNILKKMKASTDTGSKRANMIETMESWKANRLGVVAAWVNWSEIIDFINNLPVLEGQEQSQDAYILLMSKEGFALTQPYFDNTAVLFRENLIKNNFQAAEKASQGESGYTVEAGRYRPQAFIGYAGSHGYRDFLGFGWSVLIFQNPSIALDPIKKIGFQVGLVSLVVVLAASLVTLLVATGISRPIEKLAEFTHAVGRGDFSRSVPIQSQDEVGTLAVSFNEMITNLKKAKTELTATRDFADNIIRSIADALIVTDTEGRIKSCNPAVRSILGFEEKELSGMLVDKIFSKELREDRTLIEGIKQGQVTNRELELESKSGVLIPVFFSSTKLRDPLNHFQGAVLIARDMRQYKQLQSQYLEAQKMDAVGRLAGGVAHDFNNMLTVINGYSEDILIGLGSAEALPRKVGEIFKAGRRATRLVAQLLSFSRRKAAKPAIININYVIQGMDKMLKLITGTRIEIVILLSEDLWPVRLDSGQFEQMLTNLCVNARDALPEGGKVVIATRNLTMKEDMKLEHPSLPPGEYVLLQVQDNGTGMPPEVKERIFEPFFTTKPKGKGTGLGLAHCFEFMSESNGKIEVDSEVGKGTVFSFYFPRVSGTPSNLIDQEIPKDLPRGKENILLVEDEDLVREFTQRALVGLGYKVAQAMNGQSALKAIEESQEGFDLILSDVFMPGMSGPELAKIMKERYPKIKIIFMSGYVESEDIGKTETDFFYLQKPILTSVLALKIREILDSP